VVFASYSTALSQFKRLNGFKRYMHIWRNFGKETADRVAQQEGLPITRPNVLETFSSMIISSHLCAFLKEQKKLCKLMRYPKKGLRKDRITISVVSLLLDTILLIVN
jgi:hypothetical protein